MILVKPYPHAAPYLIGILTGYFLHQRRDLKLNRKTTLIGWSCSSLFILTALFITWQWNQGHAPSPLFGSLYAALFRSLWAASMAWVVIACNSGRGGFINTLLSWTPFIPMSRVSYTAYLIHPGLMYVFVASTRNLFMFSHFLVIYLFLSHLLATYLVSFILSLIIEIPFIRLEQTAYKYFLEKSGSPEDDHSNTDINRSEKKDLIFELEDRMVRHPSNSSLKVASPLTPTAKIRKSMELKQTQSTRSEMDNMIPLGTSLVRGNCSPSIRIHLPKLTGVTTNIAHKVTTTTTTNESVGERNTEVVRL